MTTQERVDAKIDLIIELHLTVRCIEFYGWSRILGFIP
jgi:hypothetical protein